MILKRSFIIVSIILVVALLGACVRSASTPPVSVVTPPTSELPEAAPAETGAETGTETGQETGQTTDQESSKSGEVEVVPGEPAPTNDVLRQLEQFVTQTAVAAQIASGGQPAAPVVEGTPVATSEGQTGAAQPGSEQATEQQPGATQPNSEQAAGQQPEATQPSSEQAAGQQPGATQTSSEQAAGQQPGTGQQPSGGQTGTEQPSTSGGQTSAAQPTAQPPASTAPGSVPITATPGIPKSYTLQTDEFPYCIARRFDVNPFELLSINGLTTSTIVRGGMVLRIPQTGNHFPGERSLKAHPTTYVVETGENIFAIACSFGDVSPDMIALANGLQSPFTLTAGRTLYIP